MQYLYGASVQGIQSFIFQTNKLKDIVGASELVEQICTTEFANQIGKRFDDLSNDPNAIVNAAGNIKYIFNDETICRKTFLEFPKRIQQFAPGITISQAVVSMDEAIEFGVANTLLEEKLKIQRNRPTRSTNIGIIGVQRSRNTGLPIIYTPDCKDYLDAASYRKRKAGTTLLDKIVYSTISGNSQIVSQIDEITDVNEWIAVIHADGNGMGDIVRKITDKDRLKAFSSNLNKATAKAVGDAITAIESETAIPFRPIVLGGDDITVIVRGNQAIEFTRNFLNAFEINTREYFSSMPSGADIPSTGMAACAGIAFIKSSYPFYFGYNLACSLCDIAKSDAKSFVNRELCGQAPSCLMFHKVQDSFITDFNDIRKRELSPRNNYRFDFGPYYLRSIQETCNPANPEFNQSMDYRWTIDELMNNLIKLDTESGNAVKSHLRNWLDTIGEDGGEEKCRQLTERLKSNVSAHDTELLSLIDELTTAERRSKYPIYDLLSLYSVQYNVTK